MTLEEIYYIGQSVAVLAILASLLGIFYQMRQSQKMERAESQRSVTAQARGWIKHATSDPALFTTLACLLEDYDGATPWDQHQFGSWCLDFVLIISQANFLWVDDFMNEEAYWGFLAVLVALLGTTGGAQWWQSSGRYVVSARTVAHIEFAKAHFGENATKFEKIRPEFRAHFEQLNVAP